MTENMVNQLLCDAIIEYVKSDEQKYAVAIQGPWGCGKTRFVESVLAPALKKSGKRLVRVSLFGCRNAEDVYEKLAAVLVRLGDGDRRKNKRVIKNMLRVAPGVMSSVISKTRVPLQLDVGPKFLVDLVLSDRHVIVFDDVERRSVASDELSLFSAVNELVEGRGQKVIFVMDSFDGGGDSGRSFDADVREKLVWRVYSYQQDIHSLVCDIFGNLRSAEFDVLECVYMAVQRTGCVNARALQKVRYFLADVLEASASLDCVIDSERLSRAVIDILEIALLLCEGKVPSCPEILIDDGGLADIDVSYIRAEHLYYQYCDLRFLEDYFSSSVDVSSVDLGRRVCKYLQIRYGGPVKSASIRDLVTLLESEFLALSDDEVDSIVACWSDILCDGVFGPADICDLAKWSSRFFEYEFEGALSDAEFVICCKRVIQRDLFESVRYFSSVDYEVGCYKSFFGLFSVLSDYAFHSFSQEISDEVRRCASLGIGVESFPMLLTAASRGGVRCITEIRPADVARCCILLGSEGQSVVKKLLLEFARQDEGSDDHLVYLKWIKKVQYSLLDEVGTGRMAEVRRKELIRSLGAILDPPLHIVF